MLQRVQTLYWFISILFISIFLFISYSSPQDVLANPLSIAFGLGASIILLVCIFSYKNRKRQLFLSAISILLLLIQIGILVYFNIFQLPIIYITSGLLVSSFIFSWMGIRSTQKDVKLIKDSSRLR